MNGVLLIMFVLACTIRVDGRKLYEFLAVTKVGAPAWGPSLWLPPGAPQGPRRLVSCDGLAAFSFSPFSFPRACSPLPPGARAGPGNSISWGSFLQSALNFFSAWCRSGVNSSGGVLDYRVGVLSASSYPILLLIAAVFVVHSLCNHSSVW